MEDLIIRHYQSGDEQDVIRIWQQCGLLVSWNNPYSDIERKQEDSPELFFVGVQEGKLVATCMAGYEGHRGWLYYLAVDEECRHRGIATGMVQHAEAALQVTGCPKIDLMIRNTNEEVISFYRSMGYELDPVVVMSKRLVTDTPYGTDS